MVSIAVLAYGIKFVKVWYAQCHAFIHACGAVIVLLYEERTIVVTSISCSDLHDA